MATRTAQTADPLAALLNMTPLSPSTQKHLRRVYTTLATSVAAAAFGAAVEQRLRLPLAGALSALLSLGATLYFLSLPVAAPTRGAALHAAAAAAGAATGPLLAAAADVDPALPAVAFAATASIFVCLSGAAVFSRRRQWVYLGGLAAAGTAGLFWVGVLNMFVRSSALWSLQIYGGLLVFCGYVVYDSQQIVERAEAGDRDHLRHALELFTDLAGIFRRVLVLLIQSNERKARSAEEKRRRQR
jgi:Bax inhibitor 1